MSINDAKWTVAPDVLASSITVFLLLTLVKFHAEIFSNFSHSLSTAAFAAGIFIAWGTGINLWTKLYCCNEFSPFPAIWSSWWFGIEFPIRILEDSSPSRTHASFVFNFVGCTTPTILHNFAWHSRSNWCFQLLTRVLDGFLKFRIVRVDETIPSQFSCVFKMELLIRRLLLLFQLGVLSHWSPKLWPQMIWPGCKLFPR